MRNEREMFDLILHVAKGNERVRGAWLNGSRANPNVPKDRWQDYDIVYLVKAMDSFLADHRGAADAPDAGDHAGPVGGWAVYLSHFAGGR